MPLHAARHRSCPPYHFREAGFTLIEVLLALAVFALSFGLILETLGGASRNVRVAGDLGQVALLAQNQLDTLGVDSELREGVQTGKLNDTYSYTLTVTAHVPEDSVVPDTTQVKLFRVDLDVSWGRGRDQRVERFSTLRSVQKQFGQ